MENEFFNPRIDLSELQRKISQRQARLKAIYEMSQTEGWQELRKILEAEVDKIARLAIDPGFKDVKTFIAKTATARAIKFILDTVDAVPTQLKNLSRRAEKLRKMKKEG